MKSCPVGNENKLDCKTNKYVTTCQKTDNADSDIAVNIYPTSSYKPVCMPTSDSLQQKIASAVGQDTWQSKAVALGKVWPILLAAVPIAIVLSVIFMIFMRLTASCFVYLLIGVSILACIGLGAYLIASPNAPIGGMAMNKIASYVVGGLLIAFGVLIGIGLCCYRKRIRLASIIVQASARFVKENCTISFLPLVLFLILLVYLTLWILQALGFYSMGTPVH